MAKEPNTSFFFNMIASSNIFPRSKFLLLELDLFIEKRLFAIFMLQVNVLLFSY